MLDQPASYWSATAAEELEGWTPDLPEALSRLRLEVVRGQLPQLEILIRRRCLSTEREGQREQKHLMQPHRSSDRTS